MSTLAMALAVTLAAGSAPAKVSGETRQALDLRGEWRGVWYFGTESLPAVVEDFREKRCIVCQGVGLTVFLPLAKITDRGDGRLFVGRSLLGAYRQQPDHVSICYCPAEKGYPAAFRSGEEQHLIVLHRVKPRK